MITKFGYCTAWLIDVIQQVLKIIENPKDRLNFLSHISSTFKDVLAEVAELGDGMFFYTVREEIKLVIGLENEIYGRCISEKNMKFCINDGSAF